jgi:hypothetical protein
MTIYVQRETDDWVGKTLTQDGVTYTGAWSYQIVAYGSRPTGSWTSAVVSAGNKGINLESLAAGNYWVFYRIDGQGSYTPVLDPEVLVVH